MEWINVILQGVLVGGLYAMFAAGLSLIFGVMRLVNIAHGDLIVLVRLYRAGRHANARHRPAHLVASWWCRSWPRSAMRCNGSCSTARSARICCRRFW